MGPRGAQGGPGAQKKKKLDPKSSEVSTGAIPPLLAGDLFVSCYFSATAAAADPLKKAKNHFLAIFYNFQKIGFLMYLGLLGALGWF